MMVATLLEPDHEGLETAMKESEADAYEIRLDALRETADPARIRRATQKPLIATARRATERGRYRGDEDARRSLLRACAAAGFDFIDVEADVSWDPEADRTIRSEHDFQGPRPLEQILSQASQTPPKAVYKYAAHVERFEQTLELLEATRALHRQGRRSAIMGMGDFPRALLPLWGATLVYGGARENAPGQPALETIRNTLRHWGQPRTATTTYLVVGDPIDHSLSPRIHNAAFQQLGIDANYGALRVANAEDLNLLARRSTPLGVAGLSVTTPLKEAAFRLCKTHTPQAKKAEAVNCVRFRDGVAHGHNTDGLGAKAALASALPNPPRATLLLGAGPAARAIASEWAGRGLTIAARRDETAQALAQRSGASALAWSRVPLEAKRFDLLINATRAENPVPLPGVRGALFDLHYGSQPVAWQELAARGSLAFVGGDELLVQQGLAALEFWTGSEAPEGAMRAALEAHT